MDQAAPKYATVDDLFDPTEIVDAIDHTLPSGKVVRLRPLTGYELQLIRRRDDDQGDALALSMGMVQPKLTEAQAVEWLRRSPAGETQSVIRRLRDLSGLSEGADAATYKSVR